MSIIFLQNTKVFNYITIDTEGRVTIREEGKLHGHESQDKRLDTDNLQSIGESVQRDLSNIP